MTRTIQRHGLIHIYINIFRVCKIGLVQRSALRQGSSRADRAAGSRWTVPSRSGPLPAARRARLPALGLRVGTMWGPARSILAGSLLRMFAFPRGGENGCVALWQHCQFST